MRENRECPFCGGSAPAGRGDLARCPDCSKQFWAVEWLEKGRPVLPRESRPLNILEILAFHIGVLAAELVLACAVVALTAGPPLYAAARLAGVL